MNLVSMASTLPVIKSMTYDQNLVTLAPGTDEDVTFVGDAHAALSIVMNVAARDLGIKVCHVVSPTALTVLQSAATSGLARIGGGVDHPMQGGIYIGTLNDVPVLIDQWANDACPVRTIGFNADGDLRVAEVALKNISFI